MELIADILLIAGATGAAIYCLVLARRLKRLTQLEGGMGSAIAVLSAQVDDLTRALSGAQKMAADSSAALEAQTRRAEAALRQMELVMAAMHDLPQPAAAAPPQSTPQAAPVFTVSASRGSAPKRQARPAEPEDSEAPDPAPLPPWKSRPSGLGSAPQPADAPKAEQGRRETPSPLSPRSEAAATSPPERVGPAAQIRRAATPHDAPTEPPRVPDGQPRDWPAEGAQDRQLRDTAQAPRQASPEASRGDEPVQRRVRVVRRRTLREAAE